MSLQTKRYKLESKDGYERKGLGRSPDIADSIYDENVLWGIVEYDEIRMNDEFTM